jgi:hypothetical protein
MVPNCTTKSRRGLKAVGTHLPGLRATAVLVLCATTLFSVACSEMRPAPPLNRRVVVLDFTAPTSITDTDLQIRGWWFGARTIFQNPEAGVIFGDALSRQLLSLDFVEQHSRADLKYYMARKLRRLMDTFAGLTDDEYDGMLAEVSPLDFGEELGVDQVITGRIVEAYASHNRTIHIWHSYAKVEVDIWDMATGQVVWSQVFDAKKRFSSESALLEKLAARVVEELDANYYQLQDRPSAF